MDGMRGGVKALSWRGSPEVSSSKQITTVLTRGKMPEVKWGCMAQLEMQARVWDMDNPRRGKQKKSV